MARFKDKREADKHRAEFAGAQQALFEMRTQYAMRLTQAVSLMKMTMGFAGGDAEATGNASALPPSAVDVMSLADALAREDMRLRVEETKLLAIILGEKATVFDLPKVGDDVKGPEDAQPRLVKSIGEVLEDDANKGIPAIRANVVKGRE